MIHLRHSQLMCKLQSFKASIVLVRKKEFGLVFLLQIVIAMEPHTTFKLNFMISIMAKIIYW